MFVKSSLRLAESGFVPDRLIRHGVRRLLANRIATMPASATEAGIEYLADFVEQLRRSPLAVATDAANQQHYEVSTEFYQAVLGPRLKYSCCRFSTDLTSLPEAEDQMLYETCCRAELDHGMRILDLGCGWGSLSLWVAEHYRNCEITSVSNSASQRTFIENRARENGFNNVRVVTADMRTFETRERYDRIVSVEMFEHMRNYAILFRRVASWLVPEGKAFVHVFCHRTIPYLFDAGGAANWMGRHFFTGGQMPSEGLFESFQEDLAIENKWRISGLDYWRTCECWLRNLDVNRTAIHQILRRKLSSSEARTCLQRWRMFFMACAELFRFQEGKEWFVAHYLFGKSSESSADALRVDRHATAM